MTTDRTDRTATAAVCTSVLCSVAPEDHPRTPSCPPVTAAPSFQRCPVWVPQDPNVPHNDRLRCILPSNHQGDHVGDERFTGLHHKYDVKRLHDVTGKHADCRYFVLDPQHDPLAREALGAYANAAAVAGYTTLAMDLNRWLSDV